MFRVAKPGGFVLVNVAAMESLRGDHSVLSREVRRYSRASLVTAADRRRIPHRAADLHERVLFPAMALVRAAQRRRGLSTEEHADQEITRAGRAGQPGADGGIDGRKLVAARFRQPVRQLAAVPG